MQTEGTSQGILGSVRALGAQLLGSLKERIELFSLEYHEQNNLLLRSIVWTAAILFTGMMALIFASLTLVYLFWDTWRIPVLAGLAILYLAVFGTLLLLFRRMRLRQPLPFASTLRELEKDRACILGDN